jgi:hypothetical protein
VIEATESFMTGAAALRAESEVRLRVVSSLTIADHLVLGWRRFAPPIDTCRGGRCSCQPPLLRLAPRGTYSLSERSISIPHSDLALA